MHPQDSIDFLSATESMISIHSDSVEDTIQVKRLKQLCRLRSPLLAVISANFPKCPAIRKHSQNHYGWRQRALRQGWCSMKRIFRVGGMRAI